MSRLDDMFASALAAEVVTPSDEQVAAVADDIVSAAVRRRRALSGIRAGAVAAALVVVIVIGSLAMRDGEIPPAPSPTAAPVVSDLAADPRMPQAPLMTPARWDTLDASWDAEFASFANKGADASGSAVAIYLTTPRGERELAYADANFPLAHPVMLAWNSNERLMVLIDSDTNELWFLLVERGVYWPANLYVAQSLDGGWPMGRSTSGLSYFALMSLGDDGVPAYYPFYLNDNGYPVAIDGSTEANGRPFEAVSPVWGEMIVVATEDGLSVATLTTETGPFPEPVAMPKTRDCTFAVWTFTGTFIATCNNDADVVEIDPTTGAQKHGGASPQGYFAISTTRGGFGAGDTGYAMDIPPLVFSASSIIDEATTLVDLRDGFTHVPNNYAVIFGVRPAAS